MALTADTWWTNSHNIQGGPEKNMKLPKKRNIVKVLQIMTELWGGGGSYFWGVRVSCTFNHTTLTHPFPLNETKMERVN